MNQFIKIEFLSIKDNPATRDCQSRLCFSLWPRFSWQVPVTELLVQAIEKVPVNAEVESLDTL